MSAPTAPRPFANRSARLDAGGEFFRSGPARIREFLAHRADLLKQLAFFLSQLFDALRGVRDAVELGSGVLRERQDFFNRIAVLRLSRLIVSSRSSTCSSRLG